MTRKLLTTERATQLRSPDAQHASVEAADAFAATSLDLLHGGWYTTKELADLLRIDPSALRHWRTEEPPQGPPFVRMARRQCMYSVADVQQWLRAQRTDTSAAAQ